MEEVMEKKVVLSRVGKQPVALPKGVEISIDGMHVRVKGPKGVLERDFVGVAFERTDSEIVVHPDGDSRQARAMHGLGRALLNNMVTGVSEGYKRELDVVGVGFRCELMDRTLRLQVGFSHPVMYLLPDGIDAEVEKQTHLILTGIDKEVLGQAAASIRGVRPPEPYKGKGIRYTNEKIRMKAGKSAGKK